MSYIDIDTFKRNVERAFKAALAGAPLPIPCCSRNLPWVYYDPKVSLHRAILSFSNDGKYEMAQSMSLGKRSPSESSAKSISSARKRQRTGSTLKQNVTPQLVAKSSFIGDFEPVAPRLETHPPPLLERHDNHRIERLKSCSRVEKTLSVKEDQEEAGGNDKPQDNHDQDYVADLTISKPEKSTIEGLAESLEKGVHDETERIRKEQETLLPPITNQQTDRAAQPETHLEPLAQSTAEWDIVENEHQEVTLVAHFQNDTKAVDHGRDINIQPDSVNATSRLNLSNDENKVNNPSPTLNSNSLNQHRSVFTNSISQKDPSDTHGALLHPDMEAAGKDDWQGDWNGDCMVVATEITTANVENEPPQEVYINAVKPWQFDHQRSGKHSFGVVREDNLGHVISTVQGNQSGSLYGSIVGGEYSVDSLEKEFAQQSTLLSQQECIEVENEGSDGKMPLHPGDGKLIDRELRFPGLGLVSNTEDEGQRKVSCCSSELLSMTIQEQADTSTLNIASVQVADLSVSTNVSSKLTMAGALEERLLDIQNLSDVRCMPEGVLGANNISKEEPTTVTTKKLDDARHSLRTKRKR
jgi:hypothetical protein